MSPEQRVAEQFDLSGPIVDIRPYGDGLINDTYLVTTDSEKRRRVILQRINRHVFPEPRLIMANLRAVLDHVHRRQAKTAPTMRDLRFPELYTTHDQRDFIVDPKGEVWRAMGFIENAHAIEILTGPTQAAEVGFALGRFHALIHDLDPQRLRDTLRGFHITPRYLARFTEVANPTINTSQNPGLRFCVAFIEARRGLAHVLEEVKQKGVLPIRPVHGDPKLNNFLFDEQSGRAVSLIDLDTVQPGLIHYDIGDCLRSCCNPAGESPDDPTDARFDPDLCRAVLKNYLGETSGFLTAEDYDYLYDAIRLIPFELGIRFLTDHLEGNPYFKTDWPEQNLHRAMTQFQLTAGIERQEKQIRKLIADFTEN